MFTGIVRELGSVDAVERRPAGARIRLRAPQTASAAAIGDSVALNGVCLTVTAVDDGALAFDAVPETLRRTSLGRLASGARVNVEPALRAGEPLGGHIVQGHVDGVGRVRSITPEGEGARLAIDAAPDLLRYCAEKGSIAVEGVSLTIAAVDESSVEIALIPHTLSVTTLGSLAPGHEVNVEVDVVAKYVERLLPRRSGE
jgi:riboflavin synthase